MDVNYFFILKHWSLQALLVAIVASLGYMFYDIENREIAKRAELAAQPPPEPLDVAAFDPTANRDKLVEVDVTGQMLSLTGVEVTFVNMFLAETHYLAFPMVGTNHTKPGIATAIVLVPKADGPAFIALMEAQEPERGPLGPIRRVTGQRATEFSFSPLAGALRNLRLAPGRGAYVVTPYLKPRLDVLAGPINDAIPFGLRLGLPILVLAGVMLFGMLFWHSLSVMPRRPTVSLLDALEPEPRRVTTPVRFDFPQTNQSLAPRVEPGAFEDSAEMRARQGRLALLKPLEETPEELREFMKTQGYLQRGNGIEIPYSLIAFVLFVAAAIACVLSRQYWLLPAILLIPAIGWIVVLLYRYFAAPREAD